MQAPEEIAEGDDVSLKSVFDLICERTEQHWAAELARIEALTEAELDAELRRVEAESKAIDERLRLRRKAP